MVVVVSSLLFCVYLRITLKWSRRLHGKKFARLRTATALEVLEAKRNLFKRSSVIPTEILCTER